MFDKGKKHQTELKTIRVNALRLWRLHQNALRGVLMKNRFFEKTRCASKPDCKTSNLHIRPSSPWLQYVNVKCGKD